MIDIIKNISSIIELFAPGYFLIRIHYLYERPRFKLEYTEIVESIFISLLINKFVKYINIVEPQNNIILAIFIGIAIPIIFQLTSKCRNCLMERLGIKFKREFTYDILKKYLKDNNEGCYVRATLHDEKIKITGTLDYYDDVKDNHKYIAIKDYDICNLKDKLIEKGLNPGDIIILDQYQVKYLQIYRK